MITTKTFDRLCHEALDVALDRLEFAWHGDGVYVRSANDGEDSIAFDFRPSRGRFCVMIGYWPAEFHIIDELHPELTARNRGCPCRPYLTSNGTTWQPQWWRAKDRESAVASLRDVLICIESAAIEWLARLRDRQFFAEHTDPVAAVCSGYAHELAGNTEVARARYNEVIRRLGEIEKIGKGIRGLDEAWRDAIFVKAKLGCEDTLTAELRALANWSPAIEPLESG